MRKKHIDYALLIAVLIISIFGIVMIYSASSIWSSFKYNDAFKYVKHQVLFFIIGLGVIMIALKIDLDFLKRHANLILGICFLLLLLVLIPGIGSIRNGSRSWFGIGSFGLQPSEFSKIGLIIYTAKYLERNQNNMGDVRKGALPIFLVIGVFFLLIMLEPDFGTAMVITLTLVCLIFVSGLKISFIIKLGVMGILGVVGLILLAPYRMARIVSFLNPWSDPLGAGYQIIQSLFAIGPGGLLGMGFLKSRQKHFYLPEPQTDFIFSIISEEFGFLGVLIVCFFFCFMFIRMIKIAMRANDLFTKYLAFGLAFGIFIQASLNLAVVVGLIPVTGVTLPFLSYGGSSLLVSMLSVGLILNISRYGK